METRKKIKDNKEESLREKEASVHAVTLMDITLTCQTGTWQGKVLETRGWDSDLGKTADA